MLGLSSLLTILVSCLSDTFDLSQKIVPRLPPSPPLAQQASAPTAKGISDIERHNCRIFFRRRDTPRFNTTADNRQQHHRLFPRQQISLISYQHQDCRRCCLIRSAQRTAAAANQHSLGSGSHLGKANTFCSDLGARPSSSHNRTAAKLQSDLCSPRLHANLFETPGA